MELALSGEELAEQRGDLHCVSSTQLEPTKSQWLGLGLEGLGGGIPF